MTNKPQVFKLEKAPLGKVNIHKLFEKLSKDSARFKTILDKANSPKYVYWDNFKHKFKPEDLSIEEMWFLVRQFRNYSSIDTPIKAEDGQYFKWLRLPSTDEHLHKIDMLAGGQLSPISDSILSKNKQQFINRGIIEEAIASSQLEGAHTTRAAARKMIIENKTPQNKSETMILNNYKTINAIEENYKNSSLTTDLLFELHAMITKDTVPVDEQFRLRLNKDNIVVQGFINSREYITHEAPDENFVKEQIQELMKYANDENQSSFIHPIVKAIFIHFWIGYLHPFTDGNGRLARAMFYWYLLRQGYWTFMYLPISTVIKQAPIQYAMAYIYSEQDNLDATYFYDFHMRKIIQSLSEFQNYLLDKVSENNKVDELISQSMVLNDRQRQLIHYFISDQNPSSTSTSYAVINDTTRQTASKDLKELVNLKLIFSKREGQYTRYYPSDELRRLIVE